MEMAAISTVKSKMDGAVREEQPSKGLIAIKFDYTKYYPSYKHIFFCERAE